MSPGHGPAGRVDAVIDCFGCSDLLTIGADFDDEYQRVHKALLAAGVENTRYLLQGAGHDDMAVSDPESGLPWSSTTTVGIITDFLHRHLDRS